MKHPKPKRPKTVADHGSTVWARPEIRFVVIFIVILGASFAVIALNQVNDAFVDPYTALIARMSGAFLRLFGEAATVTGCEVRSPRFAVTIFNGCNGLITSLVFVAAVLAFPAGWKDKLIGVVGGIAAIQAINMVRILSLFYIGVYLPEFFSDAHVLVWQSMVLISGAALWVVWAGRAETEKAPEQAEN